jgi:hypothetical protein
LSFVKVGCLDEFQFRLGMELKVHRLRRERKFSKTRAPGTGLTLPSTTSR